ncbi:hypothetical protein C8Z91_18095 [Paenibacillus elgii]|uniref:SLH domain-containing protein n=1 Tax=Paenibacillus elgii TaxID=189691 RepID=A0A2T6G132_9BACL|nr:Ig-like domain-containing protein [Paenibacillus elgii]PUA37873.1 hypothetical protein C8Z91_18095 [Paenibacillus elgii]
MLIASKGKTNWKKSLKLLLIGALAASSWSAALAPHTAKAAPDPVSPGGVTTNPHLWLRADNGITAADGKVVEWKDLSGNNLDFSQTDVTKQPAYNDESNRLNFNKGVTFDGVDDFLLNANGVLGNGTYNNFNAFVVSGIGNTTNSLFWEVTSGGGRLNVHLPWGGSVYWDAGLQGTERVNTPEPVASGKYYVWNFNYGINGSGDEGQSIYRDGKLSVSQPSRTNPVKGANSQMTLGSQTQTNSFYQGQVGEVIFYSAPLTAIDRQKINSYLAVKYGISLNNVNYLDSKANVIWQADAKYNGNIAGIARDDAQALYQKQSRSTNDDSKLTIGLGSFAEKNEEVVGTLNDKQSLIWGDNGQSLAFKTPIGTTKKNYTDRIWKVQNTNNVDAVQLTIAKSALISSDATLLVSNSETDFTGAAEYALTEISSNGVSYYTTATKVPLADGQYFTFAAPAPVLESAALEQMVANRNQIILKFDQDLDSLTNLNGFEIKVGSDKVTIGAGDYKVDPADPKKLILTLPNGTDVTGKTVSVSYDGSGTLKGKNSVPARNFTENAKDAFAASLTITAPNGDPAQVTEDKPTIEGKVEVGSTVKVEIKDKNGNPVTGAGGTATVDGNGNWTFTPGVNLTDGSYTIEVTATKEGKAAAKTKELNVATPAPTLKITEPSSGTVTVSKPVFKGTATPGSQVTVNIADGITGTVTADTYGNWSYTPQVNMPDGNYTVKVTAEKDGKSSSPETISLKVDTAVAPVLEITEPTNGTVTVSKPAFKGTATPGSKVIVNIADGITGTVTADTYGNWSYTPEVSLADGNYTVKVTAEKGGKLSSPKTISLKVDTAVAPTLEITEPASGAVTVSKPVFKGTAAPGSKITVNIADGITGTVTADTYGNWSYIPEVNLADGNYTVKVTATKDGKSSTVSKELTVTTADRSTLAGLQLNSWNGTPIGLSPAFNGSTTKYTASVTNSVYSVTVSSLPLDPNAKIEVSVNNGPWQEAANGAASGNLPLNVGTNTIVVKVTDAKGKVTEYTLTITRESSDSGDSDSSSGGSTTTPSTSTGSSSSGGSTTPNGSGIETSVNGKDDAFATGKESTSGDRKVTSVQVDLDKLNKALSQGNGQKLAIHSSKDGDMKVDGLTAGAVKQLADKGAGLEISNPLAIYPVPGGKMDLSAVSKQLGNAALGDIAVHIDIARSSDTLITNAKNKAAAEGYELLVTPVDLDMTFSHDGKMVRAGQLNGYAAKYIALPEGIDPNRITTGVIVNPDGSVFHVPTVVTKINSRYYALIKDLRSNGSYSVIWNPQDFDDVKNHWGKADVNNIAARLDLAGTGNNTFSPDRNVTRSEFSEIVVAGLGLKRQNAPQNKFPDVSDSAWYRSSVAIANEFDIVRGYEDGNFYGDRQITREQGMAMIARAYKLIETKAALSQEQTDALLAKYEDAKKVSAWAREDIALMIEAGIAQGNGPQLLSPQSNMTRAEVTALIARLLKTTNLIDK